MSKQRHDVGYRESRPRARIGQRANALVRHQRYDSWRIRSFARVLQPEFTVFMEPLGNRRQLVRSVGWPVPDKNMQILEHQIRVVARADPSNPERAAGPLVYALRETAAKSGLHVGKSALFASLPRCAVPSPAAVTGRMRDLDFREQPVSLYLPEEVRNPRDAAIYAPAIITPGLSLIGWQVHAGIVPPTGKRDGY